MNRQKYNVMCGLSESYDYDQDGYVNDFCNFEKTYTRTVNGG